MSLDRSHYVLIGGSGTGKTFFALRLAKSWTSDSSCPVNKTYIVNPGNLKEDVPEDCTFLAWETFASAISNDSNSVSQTKKNYDIDNCAIIFEDVIKINSANKDAIRLALNYSARRSNVFIIVITHSLSGTHLMGCLQYISNVIFFGSGLNVSKSFKVLKDYGGLSDGIKTNGSNIILKHAAKEKTFNSILINLVKQEMWLLSNDGKMEKKLISENSKVCKEISNTELNDEMSRKFLTGFEIYFGGTSHEIERKLGHFIVSNLSSLLVTHGNPLDMSIRLQTPNKGKVKVSMLDFCSCCADRYSKAPSWKNRAMLKFLYTKMEIPRFLLKNKHMRKLTKKYKRHAH